MKTTLLLCAAIGAALVLLGCADQGTTANSSHANYAGLVDASTVSGGSAGPAPGHIRQKYEP
jgi:hypothetical protein